MVSIAAGADTDDTHTHTQTKRDKEGDLGTRHALLPTSLAPSETVREREKEREKPV